MIPEQTDQGLVYHRLDVARLELACELHDQYEMETDALSMVISPLVMTSVFAPFAQPGTAVYLPGAPFLLAMGLMLIGYMLFLRSGPRNT